MTVPLEIKNRRIGVVHVTNKQSGEFTNQDLEVLTFLVSHLAIFIENAILYEKKKEQANVLHELNEKMILHQEKLEKLIDIHNQLIQQVLNEDGMSSIANTLADLVEAPIIIEDQQCNLLFSTEQSVNNECSLRDLLDQDQDIESRLRNGQVVRCEPYFFNGKEKTRIIAPIGSARIIMGYLSIIKDIKQDDVDLDIIAIKQGAMVLALELMKDKIKFEVESRYRTEFLDELLSGAFLNVEQILQRANLINYDLEKCSRVIVINVDTNAFSGKTLRNEIEFSNFHTAFVSLSRKLLPRCFAVCKGTTIKLLVPITHGYIQQELVITLNKIRDEIIRLYPGNKVIIGIGKECRGPENFQKSYQQAIKALSIANALGRWDQVVFYEQLGVYGILSEINNSNLLGEYVLGKIGPLLDHDDRKKGLSLVETLEQYLKTNGSLKDTAEALYIHVGTLKYRLRRIEEILNIDLKEGINHFDLQLAIYANHLIKGL